MSVILTAENDKKKYLDALVAQRAHFIPLCFSVDGVAGWKAASFLRRLGFCCFYDRGDHLLIKFSGYLLVLPLLFSEQLCCACGIHAADGVAWVWRTVPALTLLTVLFCFVGYSLCNNVFFLFFLFYSICMCSVCVHCLIII